MAVELGDRESGFRHSEVIKFINNEILMNGGGPEFYETFRSLPWEEVEDRLLLVVENPKVPLHLKRACAWSALALAVRGAVKQQAQHSHHIQWLQDQLGEREAKSGALAAEVQRLSEENKEAETRLSCERSKLQQALIERDVLYKQLQEIERSNQGALLGQSLVPTLQIQAPGAEALPLTSGQYSNLMAPGPQGSFYVQTPTAPSPHMLYMPGPPSSWPQTSQQSSSVPLQQPDPANVPYQVTQYPPPVPPAVEIETQQTATQFQAPPVMSYQPYMWAPMGFQVMVPQWDWRYYGQGDASFIPQGIAPLGNSSCDSQVEDAAKLQEMTPVGDNVCPNQEKGAVKPDELAPVGDSRSQSQEVGPLRPKVMARLGKHRKHAEKEDTEKQQPQEQKAKEATGKSTSEFQHQGKHVPGRSDQNWHYESGKANDSPWHMTCKNTAGEPKKVSTADEPEKVSTADEPEKVSTAGDRGGLDPERVLH